MKFAVFLVLLLATYVYSRAVDMVSSYKEIKNEVKDLKQVEDVKKNDVENDIDILQDALDGVLENALEIDLENDSNESKKTLEEDDIQFMSDGEQLLNQGIHEIQNPSKKSGGLMSFIKKALKFSKNVFFIMLRDLPLSLTGYLYYNPMDQVLYNSYLCSYYIDYASSWIDKRVDSVSNQRDKERLEKFRDLLNSMKTKVDGFTKGMITEGNKINDIPFDRNYGK